MSTRVVAKKLGVKYSPPSILLEYELSGKLRRQVVSFSNITESTSSSAVISELQSKSPQYFSSQLQKLIQKMLDHVSSNKMKQRGGINAGEKLEFSDLNKVSQDELQKAKGKMNKTFEQNQLKPGDHGFQYDKRVAFKTQGSSDWDEEDDDLDIDEDDLVF